MLIIGSMNNYLKTKEMTMKWQMRKKDPFMEKGNTKLNFSIYVNPEKMAASVKISEITLKLKTGQRLTPAEYAYLKEKSPELYEKAMKIKAEREDYRKRLEKCESKEEVTKLHAEKLNQFAIEVKAVDQSSMDAGAKLEALEEIQMRQAAITNEYADFVHSTEYKSLPDEDKNKIVRIKLDIETEIRMEKLEKLKYTESEKKKISKYLYGR